MGAPTQPHPSMAPSSCEGMPHSQLLHEESRGWTTHLAPQLLGSLTKGGPPKHLALKLLGITSTGLIELQLTKQPLLTSAVAISPRPIQRERPASKAHFCPERSVHTSELLPQGQASDVTYSHQGLAAILPRHGGAGEGGHWGHALPLAHAHSKVRLLVSLEGASTYVWCPSSWAAPEGWAPGHRALTVKGAFASPTERQQTKQ